MHKLTLLFLLIILILGAVGLPPLTSGKELGTPNILIVRKSAESFRQVSNEIIDNLKGEIVITEELLGPQSDYSDFSELLQRHAPDLMILMDNRIVDFAIRYNRSLHQRNKVKGVALMGLNLKAMLKNNQHIAGVAFEPAPYSLMTNFNYITREPLKRVLVFYRPSLFQERVTLATERLKKEGIQIVAVDVEKNGAEAKKVRRFLARTIGAYTKGRPHYDAVWVMLDSGLLSYETLKRIWIPAARASSTPFISEYRQLASKKYNFVTFAVSPQWEDLAEQSSDMVRAILFDGVPPRELGVEDLLSVGQYVNMHRVEALDLPIVRKNLSGVELIE